MKFIKMIIKSIFVLCVIFACSSSPKDELLTDLSCEPDKVIKNITGTLYYDNAFKLWSVSNPIPGTHDSVEIYKIVEMPNMKFPLEEGKQVSISGFCYLIPYRILFDKGLEYPAGIEIYYIKVTDLK